VRMGDRTGGGVVNRTDKPASKAKQTWGRRVPGVHEIVGPLGHERDGGMGKGCPAILGVFVRPSLR
jgi:hypothetical protein